MKIKTLMLLSFAGMVGMTSCDGSFLDQTQTSSLDENIVFADSTYASGFLTQIYTKIGFDTDINRFGNGGLQVACDEAEYRSSSSITTGMAFATGTINPVIVTDDAWKTCYEMVRACNKFLKRIGDTPMTETTRQQYIAECRVLRAWYYYILVRHYGGVPLLGDALYDTNDKPNATRASYKECIDYITNEVKEVLAMNVLRPRNSGTNNGRISEAVCYAILSRVYLDAASPLHNNPNGPWGTENTKALLGYLDYSKERWLESYNASKSIITNTAGAYKLFEVHQDDSDNAEPGWGYYAIQFAADFNHIVEYGDYQYPYGAFQEMILQKKHTAGTEVHGWLCPPSCGGNKNGGFAYWDLAEAFPMADGKAIDDPDGKYAKVYDPRNPKQNRDPRFDDVVTTNGTKQMSGGNANHMVYTCIGDGATDDAIYSGTPTGIYTKKMLHRACAGNYFVAPPMSRPLIRYAETLLNFAEASNEYYGPEHEDANVTGTAAGIEGENRAAYIALKLIRRRAGIEAGADGMYGLKDGMSQEEMRKAIQLERRLELCFEGFRFFDVRRWMIAEETDNATMHGLELTHTGTSMTSGYEWKIIDVRKRVFRKSMYFWPIPYNETVKTPELIQNPYYETTNE